MFINIGLLVSAVGMQILKAEWNTEQTISIFTEDCLMCIQNFNRRIYHEKIIFGTSYKIDLVLIV